MFQVACNRLTQPCGCATWDELEAGAWVRREWTCHQHIIAWLRSDKGEEWSRSRNVYGSSAAPKFWQESPGDPGEDPTGRPPLTPEQIAAKETGG